MSNRVALVPVTTLILIEAVLTVTVILALKGADCDSNLD